jgi:hypothetical protein
VVRKTEPQILLVSKRERVEEVEMKKNSILWSVVFFLILFGCSSNASDELLEKMCDNKMKVTGVLRGTVLEEESARITEEYGKKESNLKEEMDRDLKGMDDVLAGRLKDIEAGGEGDKEKKIAAAKEDIEKKKKAIIDQFEPLIKKLSPQKEYALRDAETYVEKRKATAEKEKEKCIKQAKEAGVTEAVATCRLQAKTPEVYDSCK